jgi:hypothetical protein
MTLSTRNRFLIAAFIATIPAIGTLIVSFPEFSKAAVFAFGGAEIRSGGPVTSLFEFLAKPSLWTTMAAIPFASLYAAGTVAMLLLLLRENPSAGDPIFRPLRLLLGLGGFPHRGPDRLRPGMAAAFVVGAARVIAFGRFFGVLALLASGVYANGVDFQKHGRVIIIAVLAALTIAAGIPVDGLDYDTAFTPVAGYRSMLDLTELTIEAIAVISFLVGAYVRSARELYSASLGVFLAAAGRAFLLRGDNWLTVPLGSALLIAGTWIFVVKLHRYYLWL